MKSPIEVAAEYHEEWDAALWLEWQAWEEDRWLRKRPKQETTKTADKPNEGDKTAIDDVAAMSIEIGRHVAVAAGSEGRVVQDAIVDRQGMWVARVNPDVVQIDIETATDLSARLRSPYVWRLMRYVLEEAHRTGNPKVVFTSGWKGVSTAVQGHHGRAARYQSATQALGTAIIRMSNGSHGTLMPYDYDEEDQTVTIEVGETLQKGLYARYRTGSDARKLMPVPGPLALPRPQDGAAAYAHQMMLAAFVRENAKNYTEDGVVITLTDRHALSPRLSERMEVSIFGKMLNGDENKGIKSWLKRTGSNRYRYIDRAAHEATLESGRIDRRASEAGKKSIKAKAKKLGHS